MKHPIQFLVVVLLLSVTVPASAQREASFKQVFIGLQFQQTDFDGFNAQSSEMGYPALRDALLETYAGLAIQDGRWRTGFGAQFGWMEERDPGSFSEARFQQMGLHFSTAYNLMGSDSPWLIGPEINLLFQGSLLTLSEASAINRLDQAGEAEYTKLTRLSSPIEIGLMVQREILPQSEAGNTFLLGLRAGYRLSDDEGWRIDQAVDFNNSGINPGGWFVSLFFGGRTP